MRDIGTVDAGGGDCMASNSRWAVLAAALGWASLIGVQTVSAQDAEDLAGAADDPTADDLDTAPDSEEAGSEEPAAESDPDAAEDEDAPLAAPPPTSAPEAASASTSSLDEAPSGDSVEPAESSAASGSEASGPDEASGPEAGGPEASEGAEGEGPDDGGALERAIGVSSNDGWFAFANLTTSVGLGTFVANEHARNELWDWSLSATPGWRFADGTAISARLAVSQELTKSDIDTRSQQFLLGDTWLSLQRTLVMVPVLDVVVQGLVRFYLPTSIISQYQNLLVGAEARTNLIRTFGPVTLFGSLGIRHDFRSHSSPTREYSPDLTLARVNGNELVNPEIFSPGGNTNQWHFRAALAALVTPIPEFTITASYLFVHQCTYNSFPENDPLASEHGDGGKCQRTIYSAGLDFQYTFDQHLAMSIGISNIGPTQTARGNVRFPFFDFTTPADNITTFYLSATGSFSAADF